VQRASRVGLVARRTLRRAGGAPGSWHRDGLRSVRLGAPCAPRVVQYGSDGGLALPGDRIWIFDEALAAIEPSP